METLNYIDQTRNLVAEVFPKSSELIGHVIRFGGQPSLSHHIRFRLDHIPQGMTSVYLDFIVDETRTTASLSTADGKLRLITMHLMNDVGSDLVGFLSLCQNFIKYKWIPAWERQFVALLDGTYR